MANDIIVISVTTQYNISVSLQGNNIFNISILPPVPTVINFSNLGLPGMSAYQVWLQQGNIGTEQTFFNFLKGPKGDPGIIKSNIAPSSPNIGDLWIDLS